MSFILKQTKESKIFRSQNYNYVFDKRNGKFLRFGKTISDDPEFSPFGPEIADIEISKGKCSGACKFCYKENGPGQETKHMTVDMFESIITKMTDTLTQIAVGICDVDSNPDMWKIFECARKHGVIPNYTCNGFRVTDIVAKKTSELCGAVAVSVVNKDVTLKSVRKFVDNGCKQVNIHYMLSQQTYEQAFDIVNSVKTIDGFQAIVFLQYKPKGRNKDQFTSVLDAEKYKKLVEYCEDNNVGYGFDSCSCHLYLESIKGRQNFSNIKLFVEPCESTCFSVYFNCEGIFFPCSFLEGEGEWKDGLDIIKCNDFITDIWMNPKTIKWREKLINNKRNCPYYFQTN